MSPRSDKNIDIASWQRHRRIGAGAFGEVWLVEDPLRKQPVALKFLKLEHSTPEELELFKREFALLSELRHTHLAQVYNFGYSEKEEQYYFTSEFCPGSPLLEALENQSVSYFEQVLVQILTALDYVHGNGTIHFDIKSDNILVDDREGTPAVKILDFGVAAKLKTLPQGMTGTPAYMAPEVITQSDQIDHRVDLYSLGMLCFRALTKSLPFNAAVMNDAMQWHLRGKLTDEDWRGHEVPDYLRELTEKLLAKNPSERFSSARVVLNFINIATGQKYQDAEAELEWKLPATGPLVGRESVLEQLEHLMAGATADGQSIAESAVCFLSGESGIGKSRLIDEMRRRIELQEIPFFSIVCDWQIPEWPQLADWLQLESLAGDELSEEWQTKRRVDAIIDEAKQRPLCLLIDDFHKADRDMRLFVESLAQRSRKEREAGHAVPIFALVAGDTERDEGMQIQRLSEAHITQYTQLVLGDSDRLDDVAKVLQQYSGGLPLLMVEGLRYMAPHIYRQEPIENLMPPPQIGDLYAERIQSLNEAEREFLLTIALVFRPTSQEELTKILGKPLAEVAQLAVACQRQGLTKETTALHDAKHYQASSQALALDLIRIIDAEQRQRIHLQIARGLEQIGSSSKEELGFHMAKGGETEKGRQYYTEAGEALKLAGQIASAAQYFDKAIELATPHSKDWQQLIEKTTRLLVLSGAFADASEHLERLKDVPSATREELKGWLAFKQRQFAPAREAYQKALQLLAGTRSVDRIIIENSLGNVDLQDGQFIAAESRFQETLKEEESLPPKELKRVSNNNLGLVLAVQGKTDEAVVFYQQRLARLAPDQMTDRISLLNGLGYALIQASRYDEAIEYLDQARELAEKSGALHALFSIMGNLITSLLKEARYAESLPLLKKIIGHQERLGNSRDVAFNLLRQGSTYLTLGMVEAAEECFEKGRRVAQSTSAPSVAAWFLLMRGYREREYGTISKANEFYQQTLAEAEAIPDQALADWAYYSLGDVSYEAGDLNQCAEYVAKIHSDSQDQEFEARRRLLALKLGVARGDEMDIDKEFEQLVQTCDQGKYREVLWEVYDGWGRIYLKAGQQERACQLFKQAMETLDRIVSTIPEEYRDRYMKQNARARLQRDLKKLEAAPASISVWNAPVKKTWPQVSSTSDTIAQGQSHSQLSASELEQSLNYLLEINKRMVSERDPQRLLEEIMDTAIEMAGTEEGLLLIPNAADELETRIARNINKSDIDRVHFSESVAREVFASGEAIFSINAMSDTKLSSFESVVSRGLMTVICLPLKIQNKVIGVIYMGTKKHLIVPDQLLRILQAFADLSSLALRNAEIFQNQARDNERLQADLSLTQQELEEKAEQLQELESLASVAPRKTVFPYEEIIGKSSQMEQVLQTLDKITNAKVPVFLFGETGTGKELLARALHQNSIRARHAFVAINCSAFTETILESELFGSVKGAFTGADRDRKGLFEQAHQGTLFLDEVADMSLSMQAKLLRVIQEQELMRVGGREPIKVDVRIVAAANRDLKKMVHDGEFREDLYFRLAGVTIKLPPLRDRRDDIPLLAKHLIDKIRNTNNIKSELRLSKEALRILLQHGWPGNIRELEQCLTNACLFAESEVIEPEQIILAGTMVTEAKPSLSTPASLIEFNPERSLEDYECEIIRRTVEFYDGNKSEASRRLGLSRLTLYKKLKAPSSVH